DGDVADPLERYAGAAGEGARRCRGSAPEAVRDPRRRGRQHRAGPVMSSTDRDRARRGGPGGRRRPDWQGWNGPGWNGQGWYDDPRSRQHNWGGDWHARGWSGDWRAAAWNEADSNERQDRAGSDAPGTDNGAWRRNDVPQKRVRIGDAERDQAVSLVSEHFVAGRVTQAGFAERG